MEGSGIISAVLDACERERSAAGGAGAGSDAEAAHAVHESLSALDCRVPSASSATDATHATADATDGAEHSSASASAVRKGRGDGVDYGPPPPPPTTISAGGAAAPTIVELNVGGTNFAASLQTLRSRPDSMLGRMFSGSIGVQRDSQERVFLDRNPAAFAAVLDWLRDGDTDAIHFATARERATLLREARFYMLEDLMEALTHSSGRAVAFDGPSFLSRCAEQWRAEYGPAIDAVAAVAQEVMLGLSGRGGETPACLTREQHAVLVAAGVAPAPISVEAVRSPAGVTREGAARGTFFGGPIHQGVRGRRATVELRFPALQVMDAASKTIAFTNDWDNLPVTLRYWRGYADEGAPPELAPRMEDDMRVHNVAPLGTRRGLQTRWRVFDTAPPGRTGLEGCPHQIEVLMVLYRDGSDPLKRHVEAAFAAHGLHAMGPRNFRDRNDGSSICLQLSPLASD